MMTANDFIFKMGGWDSEVVSYKYEGAAPHAVALYHPGNFFNTAGADPGWGGGVDWVASHPPWVCSVHNILCLSTL